MRNRVFALAVIVFAVMASFCQAAIKNVIFCIGDGMGPNQVVAGRYYVGAPLSFESFSQQGYLTTEPANGYPTIPDSASNGTALATGTRVDVGVISTAIPGDDSELTTMLEYFQSLGKSTGLVTTSYLTDATPAAFGAHAASRTDTAQIASDYFTQTKPNVLLGGGENGMTVEEASAAGYTVVTDSAGLLSVNVSATNYLCGQFGSGQMAYEYDGVGSQPHLTQMTSVAFDVLSSNADGFFLMIEGGNIDHANHNNDVTRMVREVKEFSDSVQAALNWAAGRDDTLIIVTADHECGGLVSVADAGQGADPSATWKTFGHSLEDVPVYAWGPNSESVSGFMKNTDLFNVVKGVISPSALAKVIAETSFLESDEGADQFHAAGKEIGFTCESTVQGAGPSVASVFNSIESPSRFRISNADAVLTFDSANVSQYADVSVSLQLSVQDAFDDGDSFLAVLTDGTNVVELISLNGEALDALTDNTWYVYSAAVPAGWKQVRLIIYAFDSSDSDSKYIDVDRIEISGIPVPEPSLLCIAAFAVGLKAIKRLRQPPRTNGRQYNDMLRNASRSRPQSETSHAP